MSIDYEPARGRYHVRWRDAGRQKSRRFKTEDEAQAFASSLAPQILLRTAGPVIAPPSAPMGDGIYPYETAAGQRWRFVFRQSDGSLTTRRGCLGTASTKPVCGFIQSECREPSRFKMQPCCRSWRSRSFRFNE